MVQRHSARPIRGAALEMHTYTRADIRARRTYTEREREREEELAERREDGRDPVRRVNPRRVFARGVRGLRVYGGVRALVPMLSADIPHAITRTRIRSRDIIIAEPRVFPVERAGNAWKAGT